ncbi:MAG TPA: aldolase/citrate lyase family protein [Vicinamibacteria bacterium]|nr:aldolase/citrate lyase family protein [Vicinamibacteria bacterium]
MSDLPLNRFKRALAAGRTQIGLWTTLGTGTSAEILGGAGFDWLLIDTEHSPTELPMVLEQLRALEGGTAAPVVRPAWNDAVLIKRLLDLGVLTLLVPFVQSAEEARRAVAATRYPPAGIRGIAAVHRANRYGRVKDYHRRADAEMCVLVQIETRAALAELEAIAAVDGVDGLFIGPSDLAGALGFLGDNRHPEAVAIFAEACARAGRVGKPIGILAPVEEDARRYLEMGFTYVAVGNDAAVLRSAAEHLRARFAGTGLGGKAVGG